MAQYPVRFGIQTPQQRGSWQEMVTLWRKVETLGFDSAWVFDHFLPIFSDPTGPCLEGWTSLSAPYDYAALRRFAAEVVPAFR